MSAHTDAQNQAEPRIKFRPIVNVLVCPSKIYIMEELNKRGRLVLADLYDDPNVLAPSIKRHIDELMRDGLSYVMDGFLIITEEGAKVARDIELGTKLSRKYGPSPPPIN